MKRRSIIFLTFFATLFYIGPVSPPQVKSLSSKLAANLPVFNNDPVTPPPPAPPEPTTTILFTGDIQLGRCVAKMTIQSGDYTYPFHYVAEKLRSADITVGSLDGSISSASPPMPCPDSMNLIGPVAMGQGLQYAGFDVLSVATNHIMDCGQKGFDCDGRALQDTLNNLSLLGIRSTGGGGDIHEASLPAIIERHGVRYAFLGLNEIDERVWANETAPGTNPLSPDTIDKILLDITTAKSTADVVVILPQWGVEYAPAPVQHQKEWAQRFLDAGATLVVGNHPHIVQPMEVHPNGLVFYSLGNFVFDQDNDFRREGMAVQVTFRGSRLESWKLLPTNINYYTFQPEWVDGAIANRILDRAIPLPVLTQ
jgi:poly-gamma-glutamate synthesis protein (capsule biosynthesis protein)